jgi:hypothetical protein
MTPPPSSSSLPLAAALSSLLILLLPPPASAQTTPASPPTPPAQWLQLEATYQNELKKIHVPLLSAYVNDLQRLAAASSNAETTVTIEKELQYLQSVISSGGVIDLTQLATDLNREKSPPPPLTPRQATNALLVLNPIQAATTTPTPAPAAVTPDAVEFTHITWLIEALPKGSYDVIAQCSVTALPATGDLTLSFAKNRLTFPLEKRHLAAKPDSFRLLKLGTLELPIDVKDSLIELHAPKDSQIKIRQLLITQAKTDPPKSAPTTTAP